MLGGTAYLYLKEEAIELVSREIVESLIIRWPWDMAMAGLQKQRLLVLTPRRPFLYQRYDKQQTYSKTGLTALPNPEELDDAWFESLVDSETPPRGKIASQPRRMIEYLYSGFRRLLRKLP